MIATETWRRFKDNWAALLVAGLFAALLLGAVGLLAARSLLPAVAGIWPVILGGGDPGAWGAALAGVGWRTLVSMLLVAVASTVLVPLAQGGLIHTVIQVQKERPVSVAEFWLAGVRHFGRLVRLHVITVVVWAGLLTIGLIMSLVPFLGPFVWSVGAGMVAVTLGGYGPYLAVAEGVGARKAAARAWQILSMRFVDVFLTLVVLAGFGLLVAVTGRVAGWIPLAGDVAGLLVGVPVLPLVTLYLGMRYRTNVASYVTPPGGLGALRRHPPHGA